MGCQKLHEWSAGILSPSGDAFIFPKTTWFLNRKHAKQWLWTQVKSIQESIKIHSLMSYPYCWISRLNSVNLTSGSPVMWEMLLVCHIPTEDHGREKGGFRGLGGWLLPHKYPSKWQNGALPVQEGNMTSFVLRGTFCTCVPSIAQL